MKKNQKYAFLDRDGTLIEEPQDTYQIDSLEKLRILDGVIDGLQQLSREGYALVMVSNQDGLGTETFPLKNFAIPQEEMLSIFKKNNLFFEATFFCPHREEDDCSCRKPKTGLLDSFLKERKGTIDFENSFMCGDRDTDRLFAENIGIRFLPMDTNGSFQDVMTQVNSLSSLS